HSPFAPHAVRPAHLDDGLVSSVGVVKGTSNGVTLPWLTFSGVGAVSLDTATHDAANAPGDHITVTGGGLADTGLQTLKVTTGPGDDTLEIDSASYALPQAGGSITFN